MRRFSFSVGLLGAALAVLSAVPAFASQIGMANFNNRLYQAHRGGDSKVYVRWSNDGTNWGGWEAQNVESNQAPVLAAFGTKLFLAATGLNGKIYTRTLDQTSATWSVWDEGNVQTPDAVAMAAFKGRLYQSFRGMDSQIYTRSFDGQTWSGWSLNNGVTTQDAPSLVAFRDKLYQSFRGTNGQIYTSVSQDGVNWNLIASEQGDTPSAPSLTTLGNKLFLHQRGNDQRLYTKTFDGQTWSNWTQVHGGDASTPDAPAIAGFKGRLYYTIQGLNNGIYTASTTDLNASNWQGWTEQGGLTPTKGTTTVANNWTPSGPGQPVMPPAAVTTIADRMTALLGGSMAGQPYAGIDIQCVSLTNWATNNAKTQTTTWQRGANVIADGAIPIGTAIATFKGPGGTYDTSNLDQHTGIFAGYDTQNGVFGFWLWNQNFGLNAPDRKVRKVFLPVGNSGQNMDANLYYVIQ